MIIQVEILQKRHLSKLHLLFVRALGGNLHFYLQNKNLNDISFSQFKAAEKVFRRKNLPFRSFVIEDRNEEVLGELFTFFILETILLGMAMKINPFDQPAVELIKTKTTTILKNI